MSWEDFHNQSERDYQCSEILMSNQHFENSAYLLQQCVEKNLKAMILKIDSQTNLRNLGHLPLVGLLEKLESQFKAVYRGSQDKNTKQALLQVTTIISKLKNALRRVQGKDWESAWKKSLGIKLTAEEDKKMINLENELGSAVEPMIQNLMPVFEDYRVNLSQQDSPLAKSLLSLTAIGLQFDKSNGAYTAVSDADENRIDVHEILSLAFRLMYELLQSNAKSTKTRDLLVIAVFIGIHTNIMIETFAHETVGRYPRMVGGKSSISLYKIHSNDLVLLSKKVRKHLDYTKIVFNRR